ncbi:transcriptional regulator [Paenibacillus sp. FSL L8-0493]|uniref:transcriptional regulator n=1 Tax=Paenibacillus TaxID=44249 RepID=UPI00096F5736|nr:transcriptional regulator [Paenibacillus odorifer]OMD29109.1 transcriptional regulator [Paenibacillus odorifer]OME06764.1 transcriptional regulator [Paenibacillus odorifer]OME53806.1 transcriptional regulator [Paenibacillus odorifer]
MEQQGKASTRAKDKYNAANYDQVKLWVKKGDRERIDAVAKQLDKSRNAFILEAIEEKIAREYTEPPQE